MGFNSGFKGLNTDVWRCKTFTSPSEYPHRKRSKNPLSSCCRSLLIRSNAFRHTYASFSESKTSLSNSKPPRSSPWAQVQVLQLLQQRFFSEFNSIFQRDFLIVEVQQLWDTYILTLKYLRARRNVLRTGGKWLKSRMAILVHKLMLVRIPNVQLESFPSRRSVIDKAE